MQNGQTEPKLYVYTTQALFVHSKKHSKKRKAETKSAFLQIYYISNSCFYNLNYFYIPRNRKNWSEWTNQAEAVYRYCESAGLFAVKRHKKRKYCIFWMQYSPLISKYYTIAFLRSGLFLHSSLKSKVAFDHYYY